MKKIIMFLPIPFVSFWYFFNYYKPTMSNSNLSAIKDAFLFVYSYLVSLIGGIALLIYFLIK